MLLSQNFCQSSSTCENLNTSSKKRCPSNSSTHPLFPQAPMSISSLSSSSSSPSSDSTPPDLKQRCSLESCENAAFVKAEESTFRIEQFFEKPKEAEERPPRSDSCPNNLLHDISQRNAGVKASGNNSFSCFTRSDGFNRFYDHAAASFDSQTSNNLVHQDGEFPCSNTQDLTLPREPLLSQNSNGTSARKSYDNISDKELRKKLKNRESAQAARDRKKAKMLSLERQVSELHERYRLVENENQELRVRIQRMEANTYWRMEKQEATAVSSDSTGVISFPFGAVGAPVHGTVPSDLGAYGRTGQYPSNLCGFGEYSQQSHVISGSETVEGGNMGSFNQISIEAATDFHAPTYGQTLWDGENIGALPNTQHSANFTVGEPGSYSDNSNMLG